MVSQKYIHGEVVLFSLRECKGHLSKRVNTAKQSIKKLNNKSQYKLNNNNKILEQQ